MDRNADESKGGSLMWKKFKGAKGQSLVELALTLPILLILLLGLVELGFALRAYLVLVNVSRETARYASRGAYQPDEIFRIAGSSFSGQLPVRFADQAKPNAEVIITYFFIPYDDEPQQRAGCPTCVPPVSAGCEECATYEITTTGTLTSPSRIDVDDKLQEFRVQNDKYNQELGENFKDSAPVAHNVAIVEIFYYHKQVLMDAPVVSWIFPDTMALYSKTIMRIGEGEIR